MNRDAALAVIVGGLLLVAVGVAALLAARSPEMPLGRLPGDLHWQRRGITVWVPVTTCLLVSALLTLILRFLPRR